MNKLMLDELLKLLASITQNTQMILINEAYYCSGYYQSSCVTCTTIPELVSPCLQEPLRTIRLAFFYSPGDFLAQNQQALKMKKR